MCRAIFTCTFLAAFVCGCGPASPAVPPIVDIASATPSESVSRRASPSADGRVGAGPESTNGVSPPAPASSLSAANDPDLIQPGDTIRIMVFGQPDLGSDLIVPRKGIVRLPLLGKITVSGLSPLDLSERIAQALQQRGLLNDPDVIVWITQYAPKRIFMIGAVANPTQISIPRHQSLTLSQAFAMAGGFTVSADRVNVRVIRRHPDDSKPVFITVDATQIITQEHLEKDIALLDGDTIVVANEARIYILGRVSRPGSYLVSQAKERTFIKLLGLAGGFSDGARSKEIHVFLKQPDGTYKKKTINGRDMLERGHIEQDFSVSPGSIIFVPTRFL